VLLFIYLYFGLGVCAENKLSLPLGSPEIFLRAAHFEVCGATSSRVITPESLQWLTVHFRHRTKRC